MAKTRVHQLAKELGIDSKLIMEEAEKHGIQLKNHMSALSDSDEMMLRAFLETARAPSAAPVRMPEIEAEAAVLDQDDGGSDVAVADAPEAPPAPRPEIPERTVVVARPPRFETSTPAVAPRIPAAAPMSPSAPVPPPVTAPMAEPAAAPAAYVLPAPAASVTAAPPAAPSAPTPAPPPPREIRVIRAVRPGEVQAPAAKAPEAPVEAAPASPVDVPGPIEPRVVRVIPGSTATPPRLAEGPKPLREAPPPRRQAEIVGRRELPPQQRPAARAGEPGRGSGFPARGSASSPGSGLIATRSEGGKRTFVVTGRGRAGPPARPGAPPAGAPGRGPGGRGGPLPAGAGPGRDRGERGFQRPRSSDQAIVAPSELTVQMPITVKGLSEAMGVKANVLIQRLFLNHKRMVKINDPLDKDTVELLGIEFDCDIKCVEKEDVETRVLDQLQKDYVETDVTKLSSRPPIVTFLGHVDHGKTSLLDAIRQTNVAAKEHGGITQHIGATRVVMPDGRAVVFLDTPGHRAFTEMRARGAQVTDVAVLVVAADDGVMPQTKEAISHARAAKVPIVVAMNKCDKPEANPMRVRQELATEGLVDEKWGGQTIIVETSATTRKGIPELVESLLLQAEVLELKANPERPAVATVLEAEQSRGEGNVARIVINDGTLRKGDVFVCGTAYGRVRAIKTPDASFVLEAGPSMPVEITGLNELPRAGDRFHVLDDLEQAKEIAARRLHLIREKEIAKASHVSLENLFEKLKGATLKIILKVDVTGSLEVLQREILSLVHPEIRPDVIHAAVGGITETDVTLADASDAVILGFHVSADMGARRLAEQLGVEIRIYQVIYKLIEELKDALEGRLKPEQREVITGEAEVRQVWKVSRLGTIAGCHVQSGIIKRANKVRVSRGGIVVLDEGTIGSLKRVKDDVRDVKEGLECGMIIERFENIEVGDVITCYEIETIKRSFGG